MILHKLGGLIWANNYQLCHDSGFCVFVLCLILSYVLVSVPWCVLSVSPEFFSVFSFLTVDCLPPRLSVCCSSATLPSPAAPLHLLHVLSLVLFVGSFGAMSMKFVVFPPSMRFPVSPLVSLVSCLVCFWILTLVFLCLI